MATVAGDGVKNANVMARTVMIIAAVAPILAIATIAATATATTATTVATVTTMETTGSSPTTATVATVTTMETTGSSPTTATVATVTTSETTGSSPTTATLAPVPTTKNATETTARNNMTGGPATAVNPEELTVGAPEGHEARGILVTAIRPPAQRVERSAQLKTMVRETASKAKAPVAKDGAQEVAKDPVPPGPPTEPAMTPLRATLPRLKIRRGAGGDPQFHQRNQ